MRILPLLVLFALPLACSDDSPPSDPSGGGTTTGGLPCGPLGADCVDLPQALFRCSRVASSSSEPSACPFYGDCVESGLSLPSCGGPIYCCTGG